MDKFYAILSKVCAWTLFVMTILGALNAVLRYSSKFIGQVWSSNAFLEGQWYLFSTVFLLGAGYTLYKDKHVRVDVLYSRLSKAGQKRINLIGVLIFAIPFCILGIWSSIDFVSNSWSIGEQSSDAGGLPRYPVKTLIPIGFSLLLLQCLVWVKEMIESDKVESKENPLKGAEK
jgi:TRAP-type mannitol/chloroaromatic compound transport system permease small subunit